MSLFVVFFAVSVVFVWRSFYAMRIKTGAQETQEAAQIAAKSAHG